MNIIETPHTTSQCMQQLKILGCELSLQTLRSYAAKGVIPKAKHEGGGRGAESWWHAETVPEAVAANELLASQRMNFDRAAEIRRMGQHIEKMTTAQNFERALFADFKVRKFLKADHVRAIRLGMWLRRKWRAMEQLYHVLALLRDRDRGSRRAETYQHMQAVEFLIRGPIVSDLMDIANDETEPVKGQIERE